MDKHIEVLRSMESSYKNSLTIAREAGANMDAPVYFRYAEAYAALTAAIAALKAVGKADEAFVRNDNEIVYSDECNPKHCGRVLIIPADAVGGE